MYMRRISGIYKRIIRKALDELAIEETLHDAIIEHMDAEALMRLGDVVRDAIYEAEESVKKQRSHA